MKLAESTWADVEAFDKGAVVLIPTGSLEQHGKHLPLFTDSLIATAVAEGVEKNLSDQLILTPTLWLGASAHHLKFPGSLSNSFDGYISAIKSVVDSLIPHAFTKFFVLNGHGGNGEPNGIAIRELKAAHPDLTFGHSGYYDYVSTEISQQLTGPLKHMAHACEAETSLVMHLAPNLVRKDKLRNDGLVAEPFIRGLCHHFDEMTEEGSYGYATLGTPEKGKAIFESAVFAITEELRCLAEGYVLTGIASSE
jgi:creatinine amidohydrolase